MTQRLTTIWVIARREVVTRARSKAFRISSALLMVAMVAGIVIPVIAARGPDGTAGPAPPGVARGVTAAGPPPGGSALLGNHSPFAEKCM